MSNSTVHHPTDTAYETLYNPFAEAFHTRVTESFDGILSDIDNHGPYLDAPSQGTALDRYTDIVALLAEEASAEVITEPSRLDTFAELRAADRLLLSEHERGLPDVEAFIAKMERNTRVGMFETFVCLAAAARITADHVAESHPGLSEEAKTNERIDILRRSGRLVMSISGLPDDIENTYMDSVLESSTSYRNNPETKTVEGNTPSSVIRDELYVPTDHLRMTQRRSTSDWTVEWRTAPPRRPAVTPDSPAKAGCPMTRMKHIDENWQQNVSVYGLVMFDQSPQY